MKGYLKDIFNFFLNSHRIKGKSQINYNIGCVTHTKVSGW